MASNQLSKSYQIERVTNFVIEKGSMAVKTSAAFVSKFTITQRIAAAMALLTSMWLFSLTRQDHSNQCMSSSKKGIVAKLKKWKIVRFSAWITGRFLRLIENVVTPKGPGRVDSQQKLPVIHSNEANMVSEALPATAENFSNESSRAPSCASVIEDPSQSTLTNPIRNVRHQMASKLKTWRLALEDECDGRTGYYELQHSEEGDQKKKSSWLVRTLRVIFGRGASESVAVQELRKRKRPEGDDYLTLYVPLNKGVHRLDESDSRHIFSVKANEAPGIRGLSIVPIIGNWYSAEKFNDSNGRVDAGVQLDHISLIQHDFITPSKQNLEEASDSEQYVILDLESRNLTPPCVDTK